MPIDPTPTDLIHAGEAPTTERGDSSGDPASADGVKEAVKK